MLNFDGIIIGVVAFFIIGCFHPLVIKGEYYFGTRCWWGFFLFGILFAALSVLSQQIFWRILCGVVAACSFWSIHEVFQQKKRVRRGWFPKNPKRLNDYD